MENCGEVKGFDFIYIYRLTLGEDNTNMISNTYITRFTRLYDKGTQKDYMTRNRVVTLALSSLCSKLTSVINSLHGTTSLYNKEGVMSFGQQGFHGRVVECCG